MSSQDAPSWSSDSFSLLITVAQLGQIVPQHVELASERTVVGVSPWLLFFGALYTHLAAIDIMISSNELFYCTEGGWRCFIEQQPLWQMIGSAVLSATLWYWYLLFSGEGDEESGIIEEGGMSVEGNVMYASYSGKFFFEVYAWFAVISSVVALLVVASFGTTSNIAKAFSASCGLSSAALNAIMWLPQIYVTWKYKHKGALSVLWVLSSIVMDVVYSVYLANLGVNFSVWANNIPDGIQTGLLLCLVLYYEYEDEKAGRDNFGHSVQYGEDVQPIIERKSSSLQEAIYGTIQ